MERRIHGKAISDEQIDAWVEEAEAGYDIDWVKSRIGRPSRDGKAAQVVPVRLTERELAALMARATRENLNRSEAIRQALAEWSQAS